MRFRMLPLFGLVAMLVAATPGSAFAGGWAMTTFDSWPREFVAGESYTLGYTILQHGETPVLNADTRIRARSKATGATAEFVGRAQGAPGHYVADVRFPDSGAWTWSVTQDWFQPQELGVVSVVPGASAAQPPRPAPTDARVSEQVAAKPALVAEQPSKAALVAEQPAKRDASQVASAARSGEDVSKQHVVVVAPADRLTQAVQPVPANAPIEAAPSRQSLVMGSLLWALLLVFSVVAVVGLARVATVGKSGAPPGVC